MGVTLDLAPDADVNSDPDNPVIGTRSFGADPEQVAAHVAAWTRGLQSTGVAACAKHFPGHGDTATDSHLDLPRIDVDPDTLAARELVPFDAAVEAGAAAVMTSHIVVPAIDPDRPATLSPLVLGMLRERARLRRRGRQRRARHGRRVRRARHPRGGGPGPRRRVRPALPRPRQARRAGAARSATRSWLPSRTAAWRTTGSRTPPVASPRWTCRRPRPDPEPPDAPRQAGAAASATRVDGDLPDLAGAVVVSVDTVANIAVGDVAWGLPPDHRLDPVSLADGLPDAVPDDVPLVVQVRDAGRRPEVLTFLRALAEGGRTAVVVEWGWPSTRDVGLTTISTRGSSAPGVAAVTQLLREAGWTR